MGFFFLLLAGVGLSLPGCSKQGEGERCDLAANGNADCDDGLVCTLLDIGRCCPPPGAEIGDARCNATAPPTNTGGTSSGGASNTGGNASGGMSGGAETGGTSSGGTPASEGGGGGDTDAAGASSGGSGG